MTSMWFHLMPHTELPDDFKEKHPSVWVEVHSSLFDPKRAHHMYNDSMDVVEQLNELARDLSVGHLTLLLQFGNMNKALAKYNTRVYAEHVKPKTDVVSADWEDCWWPKPMPREEGAELSAFAPHLAAG